MAPKEERKPNTLNTGHKVKKGGKYTQLNKNFNGPLENSTNKCLTLILGILIRILNRCDSTQKCFLNVI